MPVSLTYHILQEVFIKKVISTGGDTVRYVIPNLALLPPSKEADYEIRYIGSYQGMRCKLAENVGIHYDGISSGKLHRHFDIRNFSDPFRVVKGYTEARWLLKCYRPNTIFPKSSFVTVPMILAAKHYKIPVIIHESDMTPGLANKICIPSALKVRRDFPEILKYLPSDKAVLTGSSIREELLQGDRLSGLTYVHLIASKPVLPVIGGSLGSVAASTAVCNILPRLLPNYQVIHIYGKGNLDGSLTGITGYVQYEYVDAPLKHLFMTADLVISGAGADSICELLALRRPNLLILLSAAASREDQILDANSSAKQGFSKVPEEEALSGDSLLDAIDDLYLNRNSYIQSMEQSNLNNVVKAVVFFVESCVR